MPRNKPHVAATRLIRDAGGELVGRTRLQKIAFFLELSGFAEEFDFDYRHYGPYSEELAQGMDIAVALGHVQEVERMADWGGRYSVYTVHEVVADADQERAAFVQAAKVIDAVELELAATATYLFVAEGFTGEGARNPWEETRRRKPKKAADGRLERAVEKYEALRATKTRRPLPKLPLG